MNSLSFVATGMLPFSHSGQLFSLQTTKLTTTRDMSTKRGQWIGPVLKLTRRHGAQSREDALTRLCHSNVSVVMPARWTKSNADRLTVKSEIKSLEEFWVLREGRKVRLKAWLLCNLCRAAIKCSSSMTNLSTRQVRRNGETLYFILIFYSEARSPSRHTKKVSSHIFVFCAFLGSNPCRYWD